MHALYPVTITTKITECKEFYCRLFGFEVVFEADWYVQLLHKHSGIEIGLMQPHLANQPQDLQAAFGGHGIIYSLEVADAASEYERIKDCDVTITHPLTTEAWGQTHFCVRDPSGVTVDIVQQAEENNG